MNCSKYPAQRPVTRGFDIFFDLRLLYAAIQLSYRFQHDIKIIKPVTQWCHKNE